MIILFAGVIVCIIAAHMAARHERAVGEAFNLAGPEAMTRNPNFQKLNAALSLPGLKVMDAANASFRAVVVDPSRSLGKLALKHFSAPLRKISQENRRRAN